MAHADGAFRMGRTHLVCQDYVAVAAGEFPCVLLADGCSSSPDTDIGARLLTRSALPLTICLPEALPAADNGSADAALGWQQALDAYHRQAVADARRYAEGLRLWDMALDVTLLTLVARQERWFAALFGDGVLAALNRNGCLEVTVVSYLGGYPYYPNYLADAARERALLQHKDNLRKVEVFQLDREGGVIEQSCEVGLANAPCPSVSGQVSEYAWAAVLSDGVHSFTKLGEPGTGCANIPVPLPDMLRELLAFKTMGGQFAQRRMQRFQQQCAARGWQHHDDISMGVICF